MITAPRAPIVPPRWLYLFRRRRIFSLSFRLFFRLFRPLFAVPLQFFMPFGYTRQAQRLTIDYIGRLGDNRRLCRGIGL